VALLMVFALIAGAGTALSPCVLPILPAVFSAGLTGGRRRPLGLATGLASSFAVASVGLVYLIDRLDLPPDSVRTVAIAVLFLFGLCLLAAPLADRFEALLSRLVPGPARLGGTGFSSGLLVGISLGVVYAPCAGPILAAVVTVSASQEFTLARLLIAGSYAIGSAGVLYLLMLGGRRLTQRLRPIQSYLQPAMGVLMILVAVAMAADLDTRFQSAIAADLPSFLVNPTADLEKSGAVSGELTSIDSRRGQAREAGGTEASEGLALPRIGPAPELKPDGEWFNSGGARLMLGDLRGRVVLIDFWTYSCINCLRTLPVLESWDQRYRNDGLSVIGVHTPEFPFERDPANVSAAVAREGINYPVVQDNESATWNAYGNHYWPAEYLIDRTGQLRYIHFGEGQYEETERAIRSLLAQGGDLSTQPTAINAQRQAPDTTSPETYLGAGKVGAFVDGPIRPGERDFGSGSERLPLNNLEYTGRWRITKSSAAAVDQAGIEMRFDARDVYLVLGSASAGGEVQVSLDGHRPRGFAGQDVHHGRVLVRGQRLYRLISLPRAGAHRLSLRFSPGVRGYAFTFG
jgi:cytochrome c biogenesis protein CcdA/thiol-disulfide isomerase/thioredoxin